MEELKKTLHLFLKQGKKDIKIQSVLTFIEYINKKQQKSNYIECSKCKIIKNRDECVKCGCE